MNPENDVRLSLGRIEALIDRAADVCDFDPSVPQEVKDCVRQLDEETDAARYEEMLEQDRFTIGDHLDALEGLADQARQACEQSEAVNPAIDNTIDEARREIAELRRKLH
ncbi:hypothetical protein [Eleftheria terrae]|uniref:hypothetical protein n=1 Tax=Eleftheria terrae TaxID=1597781 RepID=UPI00263BD112|nr:hypothetical protein [Eleftheria terrae]WKB53313.1 hypothetical protein N7L95_02640 [Eleftheria terrae]